MSVRYLDPQGLRGGPGAIPPNTGSPFWALGLIGFIGFI